jgi:hypothetical protein
MLFMRAFSFQYLLMCRSEHGRRINLTPFHPNVNIVCTDLQLGAEGMKNTADDTQLFHHLVNLHVQPLPPVLLLLDLLLQFLTLI